MKENEQRLLEAITDMREDEALALAKAMLGAGDDPLRVLELCRMAMETVGKRFQEGEYFLPELILAGEMLERIGEMAKPLIQAGGAAAAKKHGVFVAVDPKQKDFAYYRGCTLITPNKAEAEAALGGKELGGDLEIWEGGKALIRRSGARAILITRGEEGMSLVERGRTSFFHIPARARQVFDVTGAGDTVIGTLAVGMGVGAPLRDAALLANVAAGVVVGEVGTAPITTEKLTRALRLQDKETEIG